MVGEGIYSKVALGFAWYGIFLFQLVLHEAAHACSAKAGGDDFAASEGLVTIDPIPHIKRHPFGTIVVPIISYALSGWVMGWGSSPYDPEWAERYPNRAGRMALAGPLTNLLFLLISGLIISLGLNMKWFFGPDSTYYADLFSGLVKSAAGVPKALPVFLSIMFTLNLIMLLLNMLPLPPFDGSAAIVLLMSESAAKKWQNVINHPQLTILGMLAGWKIIDLIFIPVYDRALDLLYCRSAWLYFICALIPTVYLLLLYTRKKKIIADPEMASAQKETGADGDLKSNNEEIAKICGASRNGDTISMKSLLEKNRNLANYRDCDGACPLHYAAGYGNEPAVDLLIAYDADINIRDLKGATPLHYAASNGHRGAAERLISGKTCINATTEDERATALHCAAAAGHAEIVELLLLHRASVNATKIDGQTPLHRAASKGHGEIVRLLLSKRARADIKDRSGKTPLDLALGNNHADAAEILKSNE